MLTSFSLEGKVALITGSSRGIGAAIAEAVFQAGGHPVITYHQNQDAADRVAKRCGGAPVLQFDAANAESAKALASSAIEACGKVDILVNNAGILEQKPYQDITLSEWDEMFDTNLKAPFFLVQALAPHFIERGEGSIINMSSVGGQFGGPKAPHYAASKGALLTLTKSLCRLLSPHGVRVNALAPGFIETDMMKHMATKTDRQAMIDQVPIGRIGTPEDVAHAAVFLASDAASFITGQVINVNGGQYLG
ncbi:SDR family NAD(P)-dependent oxidoreductase [Kordiimonas sp.]|uniref:SDR family NAD(P)-dependent oxidoreductase n=1 Tax=Kordiimonas sp. TaxID=1970157 RepID=UPI003A92EC09